MFEVISNPFEEMTQGVVSNGLGYVAEKKNKSYAWVWWTLLIVLITVGMVLFVSFEEKKIKEKLEAEKRKKLAEEKQKQKLIEQQTKNTLE